MKRIKLTAGYHVMLENDILKHPHVPKYVVDYYVMPSENIKISDCDKDSGIFASICGTKSQIQEAHCLRPLFSLARSNDKEGTRRKVVEHQELLEKLLLNKGVDDVICLSYNEICTIECDQPLRENTWKMREDTWEAFNEYFMLGVRSL